MSKRIQPQAVATTLLNRFFAFAKAVEQGSQFSLAERHAIRISQKEADLEDRLVSMELNLH